VVDLREGAALLEEALRRQRNDVRFSADEARTTSPSVRSTSDDGRYSLMATGWPSSSETRERSGSRRAG
jgi:hypothetical protein